MSLKTPSVFSISLSVLGVSHDFLTLVLVPLRQINADLWSGKEVLALIQEIPFFSNNNNNSNNKNNNNNNNNNNNK